MSRSEPPFSFKAAAARALLAVGAVLLAVAAVLALDSGATAQSSIRDGSFISGTNDNDIYRVKIVNGKQFKWRIVNPAAFNSYGVSWGSVVNVPSSVLRRYTTSNLARQEGNSAVWQFSSRPGSDSGTRRWLNITASEFEAAGFDWDAVHSIKATDFNQYTRVFPDRTCADFDVCPSPPTITGAENLRFNAGERVTSRRVATISDRDTARSALRVGVSGLPTGWTYRFDTSNGRLTVSGTAPSRAGSHRVTITASDGRGSDMERFTITIRGDEPPVVGIRSDQSWVAGSRVSERVATVSDRDTSRRDLTVTVSGLPDGIRYSFNTSNGQVTVSGTVGGGARNYTATVSASDGTNTTRETFRVLVTPPPSDPPAITLESSGFSVQTGERVTSRRVATIRDRDTALSALRVDVSGLPARWTHSFNTSNGQLTVSGTAPSSAGSHRVTITASDGRGSDVERFTITVAAAPPPDCAAAIQNGSFIRQDGAGDVYRVKIINGKQFKWRIVNPAAFNSYGVSWDQICDTSQSVLNRYTTSNLARNGDDPKVWRFESSGDSGTRRWLNITDEQFTEAGFDWDSVHSINAGDFGQYTEGEELTCADFDVCPEPEPETGPNDPPEIANLATLTVTEGQRVDPTQVATVTDREDTLRLNEHVRVSGLPPGLAAHGLSPTAGSLTISGTVAADAAGTYTPTVTANDGTNLGVAEDFQITVLQGEDLPVFDPEVLVVEEPLLRGRDVVLHLSGASGGQAPLTYTLRDAPEGMRFNANDLTVTGAPTGAAGEHTMQLRATDSAGRSAEQRITYTISLGEIGDGSLIRERETEDVYLVRIASGKQFKRRILNEVVFNGYGWDWRNVHDVSAEVMERYTTSDLAQLGRAYGNDPRVWQLAAATAMRHWLNMTPAQFAVDGYDRDAVYEVSQLELNQYAVGEEILPCTTDRIERKEPLGSGDAWTERGEWTSRDCKTGGSPYITDHIGHYRDFYSFVTSEAVQVTIDLESDDVGTHIHLLDNDSGELVPLSASSRDGNDASVTAWLEAGQKYWVRATTAELGDVGAYTLRVSATDAVTDLGTIKLRRDERSRWAEDDCEEPDDNTRVCRLQYRFTIPERDYVTVLFSSRGLSPISFSHTQMNLARVGENGEQASVAEGISVLREELAAGTYILGVTSTVNLSPLATSYGLAIVLRGLTGARTGDVRLTEARADWVAETYGPVLRLDEDEKFRPVKAEAMIEQSSLMRVIRLPERIKRTASEVRSAADAVNSALDAFADNKAPQVGEALADVREIVTNAANDIAASLEATNDQDSILDDVAGTVTAAFSIAGQIGQTTREITSALTALRLAGSITVVDAQTLTNRIRNIFAAASVKAYNAFRTDSESKITQRAVTTDDLRQYNDGDYYLDLLGRESNGVGNSDLWKEYAPEPEEGVGNWREKYESVAYVRVAEYTAADGEQWKGLQFWYFWLYNEARGKGLFDHEGDWEAVTLWFKGAEWDDVLLGNGVRPTEVGWSAHGAGNYIDVPKHACLRVTWRYPTAFVAKNNHPSYVEDGETLFGLRDHFFGDGVLLTPTGTYDVRGLKRHVGKDKPASGYAEYEIRRLSEQAWRSWLGRWGAFDPDLPSHQNGPKGPLLKAHADQPPSTITGDDWDEDSMGNSRCEAQGGSAQR